MIAIDVGAYKMRASSIQYLSKIGLDQFESADWVV